MNKADPSYSQTGRITLYADATAERAIAAQEHPAHHTHPATEWRRAKQNH
jgi:hypothetical protein